ncbi:MAG: 6-carboxytetrahydropterin synthase [Hymenobacteraceae bacterium]|nr:6-carboxytetrahydropterin synthase [Hymenobacteraceae bacterium]
MQITVGRREHFNAAHRLYRPDWSDERNTAVFGVCANPNYHGHNYELEVRLTGEPDPETGYLIDLKALSAIIKTEILDRYDHRNLNLDTEDFRALNPTAEYIAAVIWRRLRAVLPPALRLHVTLFETPRNFVEYDGA